MRRFLGSLGFAAAFALVATAALIACSDDDTLSGASPSTNDGGGFDVVQPPPPPPNFPDAPAPPTDLVSRTGYLGNATLVADVGEPTDGPSWRDSDGALYFTVPGSPNPLRRVVPGAAPSVVAVDAGTFAPIGTASGGGDRLFVTEREAVVTLDFDGGAVAAMTRTPGLGGTTFADIATEPSRTTAWFVDVGGARIYRFTAPSDLSLVAELDAGRTSAIAARDAGKYLEVPFAVTGGQGSSIPSIVDTGGTFTLQPGSSTGGIPPNAIAVDVAGTVFIAWAGGIDVMPAKGGSAARPSDGYGMLPIAAIPTGLAFGVGDRKTLFVTTNAGKIYSVPVSTAGILR